MGLGFQFFIAIFCMPSYNNRKGFKKILLFAYLTGLNLGLKRKGNLWFYLKKLLLKFGALLKIFFGIDIFFIACNNIGESSFMKRRIGAFIAVFLMVIIQFGCYFAYAGCLLQSKFSTQDCTCSLQPTGFYQLDEGSHTSNEALAPTLTWQIHFFHSGNSIDILNSLSPITNAPKTVFNCRLQQGYLNVLYRPPVS